MVFGWFWGFHVYSAIPTFHSFDGLLEDLLLLLEVWAALERHWYVSKGPLKWLGFMVHSPILKPT